MKPVLKPILKPVRKPVWNTPVSCSRQSEVRDLLRLGHWPQAAPHDLQSHVSNCRLCSDLALVSVAVQEARTGSIHASSLGVPGLVSPGLLWWRAQLRRRNEAVEKLGKPLLGAQLFALAINLVVVICLVIWQIRDGSGWLSLLSSQPAKAPEAAATKALHFEALWSFASTSSASLTGWTNSASWTIWTSWTTLLPCMATLAVLSAVVLYLATEKQ